MLLSDAPYAFNLGVENEQFILTAPQLIPYKLREIILTLKPRWAVKRGCWVFPRSCTSKQFDWLQKNLPQLSVSDVAEQRLQQMRNTLQYVVDLQQAEDAKVFYSDDLDAYQRVGVKFLSTARRAILADGVGLGKTVQALRAAIEVDAKNVLIVTRKSLIYHWQQQINLWIPIDKRDVFSITNYEQVTRKLTQYVAQKYDALILDEAHLVKNKGTRTKPVQRTRAVYTLADRVPCVWLLTATPVLNRPDELWSLLRIVDKQKYASYWKFVDQYCDLDYNAWTGKRTTVVGLKQSVAAELSADLAPVMLKRVKETVQLPPLTREIIYVTLIGEQKKLYNQMLKEFFITLESEELLHAPTVLAQFTRLRQIACSPALVGGPNVSAKTNAVLDLVDSYAPDHKILVFSAFAGYIDLLHTALAPYGAVKITGALSAAKRDEAIQTLNTDIKCRVLVGTLGAMGVGLNIQTANVVINTDRDWVPAIMEQAEGRAHRRGQKFPVHVVTIHAQNTLDDYIDALLQQKGKAITALDIITQMAKLKGRWKECP